MTNLSHSASFHSNEWITPSNRGIKQLDVDVSNAAGDAMRASYRLDDRDEIVAVHAAASFSKFTTRTLAEEVRIPDTRTMVEADLREWLPRYGIHLSQEDIARTLAAPDVVLASYAAGFGLAEC